MAGGGTKVVQITNIAPQATKDQMQNLFGNIGKIDEIRLYPTIRDVSCPVISRICYVKYFETSCINVAQHLTNTVFIDRALIVIPVQNGLIPDEYRALEMAANGTLVPGLHNSDTSSKLPPEVVNRIDGMVPNQVVKTSDPKLEENNLPEYPPLPVNFDAKKIEETRRTIIVLDVQDWRLEDLMDHFKSAGEVKYARYAENDDCKFALLEFCEQKNVIQALKMQASEFRGTLLNLHHSTQPIVKPEAKSNEAAQKEIEEAMSIVKEAQNMISAAIDPVIGMLAKDKGVSRRRSSRSRSRSKERRTRSRSRKRSKSRKRSRSRSKRRSPSRSKRSRSKRSPSRSKRSRSRSKRSRSRDRRKRSRSRKKSRSRSRGSRHRHRSRSRSRDRDRDRRRSRSRDRDRDRDRKKSRHSKDERRHRSRSRSRSRKRSSSRGRSSKDLRPKRRSRTPDKRMKKILEESITRNYDNDDDSGRSPQKDKSLTPRTEKSDNMDISNSP